MLTQNDIIKEFSSKLTKGGREITQAARKELTATIESMKKDILITYQNILQTELHTALHKAYGDNYDAGSIERGLTFSLTPNLEPSCSYNAAFFNFNVEAVGERRSFNENAMEDYTFMDLFDEMPWVEDAVDLTDTLLFDFEDTYGEDNYEGFKDKKMIIEPKTIFETAKQKADVQYRIAFESQIKPKYMKGGI